MELTALTIEEAKRLLMSKEISAKDLVSAHVEMVKKHDGDVHAFLEVFEDDAFAQARVIDKKRAAGEELPELAGIPIGVKDLIMIEGKKATAGSQILDRYVSSYDSTVARRLKEAGAILFGRTNMDEFAFGSSTENSHFGPTCNPWDLTKVPGGTSGGSAAAVAGRMLPGALGSDTGGSIRQPGSLSGVVGLKPTYGRVSRYGIIADASSFDQIGPLTRTVDDAATLLRSIEGKDPMDATSVPLTETTVAALLGLEDVKGVRIGIPKEYFIDGMDPEVEARVRDVIRLLESHGAEVVEISLPHTSVALEAYYILQPAEASTNLERFDGMRYGTRSTAPALTDTYKMTRGEGFGLETKRRIMLGTFVLSAGYHDAFYKKAAAVRTLIRRDFEEAFKHADVLLTPTSPCVAWALGEKFNDPLAMYLADIFTISVSLAGLPGMSVPCGFAHGLPVGFQLIGKAFDEATLFKVGHFYQSITDWHTLSPWEAR